MIKGLRPYPDSSPSGLAWLETLPAHWQRRRIKTLLREVDQRSVTGEEKLLSLRMLAGLVGHHEAGGKPIPPEAIIGFKRVEPGQLVMNRMRAAIGLFGVATESGLVSPDYAVFDCCTDDDMSYLLRLFKLPALGSVFRAESKGLGTGQSGFLRLYTDKFGAIRIPLPPLDEQRMIVRFLDWHGAMTGKLIRAKRRLIELLNEQKHAIIHGAVTRGLNPDAPLRDSGLGWLGRVPAHWDVCALRHRYHQCLGKMLDTKAISGNSLVRYLRNQDVQWDEINTVDLPEMDIFPDEFDRCTVEPGDLLVCEGGKPGRAAIWKGDGQPCGFQKALHRLRPINSAADLPAYMLSQLKVAVAMDAFAEGDRSTIAHLTGDMLRSARFAYPPESEQREIVAFLGEETKKLDEAIAVLGSEIGLIREFRTRLVSDVITGQLDVRDVAVRLPEPSDFDADADLTDEDELADETAALIEDEAA